MTKFWYKARQHLCMGKRRSWWRQWALIFLWTSTWRWPRLPSSTCIHLTLNPSPFVWTS